MGSGDPRKIYSRFILKNASIVAVIGTALAAIGAIFTVLLYVGLRTDMEELLPTNSRSVLDMAEASRRLDSVDNMVVLVFSSNKDAVRRFSVDLSARLAKLPKDLVSNVEYRIDREIGFFKTRRLLFLSLSDLNEIQTFAKKRIAYEKVARNPFRIVDDAEKPKLDLEALKKKENAQVANFERFPDGFYSTPDGTKQAIVVNAAGKAAEIGRALRLKAAIDQAIERLDPKKYAPDLTIHYSGNIENVIEEHHALIADLEVSTVIVILLVTLVMVAFYQNFLATTVLVFSLFMGTFWTFGVAYFVVGYLNANSAFLASIIIGNGINFGIIFLARYLEERRGSKTNEVAISLAISHTWTPTLTAALGAALSYGSLMLTDFRGFRQFGIIGFIGMVLCWMSSYTLLPAYLTICDRWIARSIAKENSRQVRGLKNRVSAFLAKLVDRYPAVIVAVTAVLTVASGLAIYTHRNAELMEIDSANLRDKDSMQRGSGFYQLTINEIFHRNISPIVVMPRSRKATEEIARRLKEKMRSDGPDGVITGVQTLADFVPKDQGQKIEVLRDIKSEITPEVRKGLSAQEEEMVSDLFQQDALQPFTQSDLPKLVLEKFTEKDGSRGKMILVDKKVRPGTADLVTDLVQIVKSLRSVGDSVEPGTPIAGLLPLSADMADAVIRDGPRATLFAFLSVLLLVVLLFRNPRIIALALFALLLGVAWFSGLIMGLHLKINFLNFIALPITFGIGIDYGINIFQRYREEGQGRIVTVISKTGAAVALCSLTTVIGYSSLLIAGNQAFVSFGRLAVLGEICCVCAAVIALPAFLRLRR